MPEPIRPPLSRPPCRHDLLEEHFEELETLWEQRETSVLALDWTLEDLAEQEDRCEAHLDALRLGELHAVNLALDQLSGAGWAASAAATIVLREAQLTASNNQILQTIEADDPEDLLGIRSALRQGPVLDLAEWLHGTADRSADGCPDRLAAVFDVLSFHRMERNDFDCLLTEPSPAEHWVTSLDALRRVQRFNPTHLEGAMGHADPSVRTAALRAAAEVGLESTPEHCRRLSSGANVDPAAVTFLGVVGEPQDADLLAQLISRGTEPAAAVDALGRLGAIGSIPLLLDLMPDPDLGNAAAKAYARITGSAVFEGDWTVQLDEEGELVESQDQAEAEAAAKDWSARKSMMEGATCWQLGAPRSARLPRYFDSLPLAMRLDTYLHARMYARGTTPSLELEARARIQRGGTQ